MKSVDGLWYAWLYCLGSEKLAKQFWCQIKMANASNPEECLTLTASPHSLDKSSRQVISANVMTLTDSIVKKNFIAMTNDQKCPGEEDHLKYLLNLHYKVFKREQSD